MDRYAFRLAKQVARSLVCLAVALVFLLAVVQCSRAQDRGLNAVTISGTCFPAGMLVVELTGQGYRLAGRGPALERGRPTALLELWQEADGGWLLVYQTGGPGGPRRCLIGAVN